MRKSEKLDLVLEKTSEACELSRYNRNVVSELAKRFALMSGITDRTALRDARLDARSIIRGLDHLVSDSVAEAMREANKPYTLHFTGPDPETAKSMLAKLKQFNGEFSGTKIKPPGRSQGALADLVKSETTVLFTDDKPIRAIVDLEIPDGADIKTVGQALVDGIMDGIADALDGDDIKIHGDGLSAPEINAHRTLPTEARDILLAQLKRLDSLATSLEKEPDDLSPINSQVRLADSMCRIAATLGDARPMYNNDVPIYG